MNPYGASGFQSLSNMSSNFEFSANETSKFGAESENPTFSSKASLSKPRIAKTRKSLSSKSKGNSEAWKNDVGYNPFRPDMKNVARVSSRLDDNKSSGVDDGVGDGDGDGVGIGRSRHLKLKVTNKVEKVGNELIDEIRKLRIANESVRGESGNKLDDRDNASKAVGNDLPSDFSSSAGGSLGGGVNVSGSAAVSLGAELPNDLGKLNLKDDGEVGGLKFDSNTLGKNDFVFGSSRANVDSVVDNTLPDNIKNLNLEDSDRSNGNRAFVSGSVKIVSSSGGVEDTMVLGEMEKLNIGGTLEGSSNKANLNESTSLKKATHAGIGEKDCSKPNLSENVSLGRDKESNKPQAPDLNKSSGLFDKSEAFSFTSKQDGPRRPNSDFRTPEPKDSLFNGSTMNLGFRSKKGTAKASMSKGRKGKVKEPKPVFVSLVNNFSPMETSYQNEASSDSYSPMDVSPCEIQDDPQFGGEPSSTSNDALDEQLIKATECMDINEGNVSKQREESMDVSKNNVNIDVDRTTTIANNDRQSEVTSTHEVEGSDQTQYFSASSSISSDGSSFKFAASSSSHGQASATLRHQRKKNRMKAGLDISVPPKMDSLSDATSPLLFSPISNVSLLSSQVGQNGGVSTSPFRNGISRNIASSTSKVGDAHNIEESKRGTTSPTATARIAQEACEKWRLRGNQAYAHGDLKKAEDYYTEGLSCIPRHETSRDCLRSLVLCHSNRAAARMSIGRVSEALQDCVVATEIDPNFFRVQLRAANCYLALGEIGNASRYFKRLLQSTDVCVERKIILEASDGLQKAQKVSECFDRSTLLLRQKTSSDTESALEIIAEALVISPYSEQLLECKAGALFMLRRYDEVIQLCEETLETAEKNCSISGANELSTDVDAELLQNYSYCTWRFGFIFKSNFYLGKLEEALEFLDKQEKWSSMVAKFGNEKLESLMPHLFTVRELLRHKSAGNRAFQTGKHTEAVEHYSAALSFNVESRPFAAVCFGNRAAAYQALGQITDAIADCSLAIALDANYSKAILRRATLFELIRDYDQAAEDLERLISLLTNQTEEKSNPSRASVPAGTVADLRQTRQRLYQMEEQAKRGIPLNFYLILGVEPSVTATDLRKAYRKAALKHHPDKAGQSLARSESGEYGLRKEIAEEVYKETDKLFKMIGEAYAVLSDPTKRSEYDIEEEMRNDLTKNGNPVSRMPNEEERGSFGRHWREGWRSSAGPYSRGFEPTRPSRYY